MIQVTFNVEGPKVRPTPTEVHDSLAPLFAGNIRIVDITVLPDNDPHEGNA